MGYKVIPTQTFKKEAKRLIKKYPSLTDELRILEKELQSNPKSGVDLGNNTYKIRVSIKSKGKGTKGGGRIITYVLTQSGEIYLLTIYDKAEFDTVDTKTLKGIIDNLFKK